MPGGAYSLIHAATARAQTAHAYRGDLPRAIERSQLSPGGLPPIARPRDPVAPTAVIGSPPRGCSATVAEGARHLARERVEHAAAADAPGHVLAVDAAAELAAAQAPRSRDRVQDGIVGGPAVVRGLARDRIEPAQVAALIGVVARARRAVRARGGQVRRRDVGLAARRR